MEHLLNDHGDRSNQHENSDRLCDETGHPIENMLEISMETESTTWSEFRNRGKTIVEQIIASEEK